MANDEIARNNPAPEDATENGSREIEEWLNNTVARTYDAMKTDPDRAVTAAHVRASLAIAYESSRKS